MLVERGLRMTHARARIALLAVTIAGAVGIVVPATAGAYVGYYNCVNKPSLQWCDGRANGSYDGQHSWNYNQGWNPGAGSFVVCQGVYKPASGNWLAGISCATNLTSNYYGNVQCICYDAEVQQQSGSPKSINGFADADVIIP